MRRCRARFARFPSQPSEVIDESSYPEGFKVSNERSFERSQSEVWRSSRQESRLKTKEYRFSRYNLALFPLSDLLEQSRRPERSELGGDIPLYKLSSRYHSRESLIMCQIVISYLYTQINYGVVNVHAGSGIPLGKKNKAKRYSH
jgi:hypothetical protein